MQGSAIMKNLIKLMMGLALATAGLEAQAIAITPGDCSAFGGSISCVAGNNTNTSAINSYIEMMYGVTYLYKSDVGGSDSQSFASSYDTVFSNTPLDPTDALITYVAGQSITCPDCYLLVKDGNQQPAWYLFDIGSWDGTEAISLSGFWPNQGAISHVAIYGNDSTNVPAPGPLALLTIGMVVLGVRQVKKAG